MRDEAGDRRMVQEKVTKAGTQEGERCFWTFRHCLRAPELKRRVSGKDLTKERLGIRLDTLKKKI